MARRFITHGTHSKYHSTKVVNELGTFDSRKEYKRFLELKWLEDSGQIKDLSRQVVFELLPNQYDELGKVCERKCKYIADFVYYNDRGKLIVEDVKGLRTDVYKVKKKLMLYIHGIRIVEV